MWPNRAFRLPVSGHEVAIRQPTGAEELLVVEGRATETEVAVELARRVATDADGAPLNAKALFVTDLEALLLQFRRVAIGDVIRADVPCSNPDCRARVDIDFRVSSYLEHHLPKRSARIESDSEPGWYRLSGAQTRFRPPTVDDQLSVSRSPYPERELAQRCVDGSPVTARILARIENALDTISPSLSRNLEGVCPDCGSCINMHFDVQRFVFAELRNQAALLTEDVHLLAFYYHWPEDYILELPSRRRARYADMIAEERGRR